MDDDRLFTDAEPVIAVELGRLSVVTIGCVAAVSIWLSLWARVRVSPTRHAQSP